MIKPATFSLEQQINDAQERLETLSRHTRNDPQADPLHLLPQALQELSNALEELHVSADELEARNEELALTRDAVERERQRYLELFEFAPDAYLVTDAVGIILEANQAAATLLRRRQSFLVGKPLPVFVAPAGHPDLYDALHRIQRGAVNRIEDHQIHLLLHHGKEADVSITVAVVHDRSGQASSIRWLLRDITERIATERRLAGTRQQLEHIMETVPDVIYTLNAAACLIHWNRRLETVTNFSPQELRGRPATTFFPDDQQHTVRAAIQVALSTGHSEVEADLLRRDGTAIPYYWSAAPLKDPEGRVIGVTGMGRDISDRKRSERALSQLSSRLIQLQDEERRRIGRELHDSTAQNLAGVSMSLSLVNQSRQQLSKGARRALDESMTLVDQCLLEIRTISYLLHPPLLDEVGLASAIRWYAEGFAQRSGIPVDVTIAPELGRLSQEAETALFRIVQEGLTNVHRHSGSPGVGIQIVQEANTITLEITDAGRGLPGFRAPSAAAANAANAQIGVGIRGMEERIRQLGGYLSLIPRAPGLTVRATLPLKTAAP